MVREEIFDYQDLQGRQATVALGNIARFTKEFAENLGRHVGHLWLKSGADVWTSDPDDVWDRLRAHRDAEKWKGFLS